MNDVNDILLSEKISIRLTREDKAELERLAAEQGRPVANMARKALLDGMSVARQVEGR